MAATVKTNIDFPDNTNTIKELKERDKEMSIFGDLDVTEISDNPFGVKAGTYRAVCTDAKEVEKDGKISLVITWTIDEPESEFNSNNLSQWFTMPSKDAKSQSDLTPDQIKSMKFLKLTMRRGFDLSEQEIQTVKPSDLMGAKAFITTTTKEEGGKTYNNIRSVTCPRLAEEEGLNENVSAASQDFGI